MSEREEQREPWFGELKANVEQYFETATDEEVASDFARVEMKPDPCPNAEASSTGVFDHGAGFGAVPDLCITKPEK